MPAVGRDRFGQAVVDLRAIPKEVRKELRPTLKRAGEAVASNARSRASWSSRIPRAIRVAVLYGARTSGVVIKVSRKRAPHARPYEGIGGRRSGGATFRHPLFGDVDWWYTQRTRPFLQPAAMSRRAQVRADVAKVVEQAARRHGFQ